LWHPKHDFSITFFTSFGISGSSEELLEINEALIKKAAAEKIIRKKPEFFIV
jgi:hypothetical protein